MKITICGSMNFAREMSKAADRLSKFGHKVFLPEALKKFISGEWQAGNPQLAVERKLQHDFIKKHYHKIKQSDAILVLNYEKKGIKGYIGGNSFLECGFAHVLNKKIYLLFDMPEIEFYWSELKAMSPIVLNGDLSKLLEKECDHTSVGMLVWRKGKLLLIERKRFPFGFAPPAGHVDDKSSFEEAARKELEEEVGLKAKNLKLIFEGRKNNHCQRKEGTWHYWKIYEVETEGKVRRNPDETKQAGGYSKKEIEKLTKRTQRYIDGKISEDEWEKSPGLEVVWCQWMKKLKVI